MRRFICLFLMMLLPLQAFAMQIGGASFGKAAFDLAHEIEHAHGIGHHHDDDGTVHYDNSDESKQHAAEDSCCHPAAALPVAAVPSLKLPISSKVAQAPVHDIRDRFPDLPQRPPCFLG